VFAVVVDYGEAVVELLGVAEWEGGYGSCLGQSRSFIFLR